MKWLEELITWYGEPSVNVNKEIKMHENLYVRTWVWFPPKAGTNHNVKIERSVHWKNYHTNIYTMWTIKINRHALENRFDSSGVEYRYVGELEPSDELMSELIKLVGFVDY